MNVMRLTACLVVNPITVNNFADLFDCTPVGQLRWIGLDDLSLVGPKKKKIDY